MNASSREVLQKCLKGIIITESNVRSEGSEDEEAPDRRGFQAVVDLRLGAIDTTNVNRYRGRKRKEQLEKSQATSIISKILKRK